MPASNELRSRLAAMDRKSYPAYKSLAGRWQFADYTLSIDHVQGDPFASPSNLHIEVSLERTGIQAALYETPCRRVALQDFLIRRFAAAARAYSFRAGGSGRSGLIETCRPGQEVLERSACEIRGAVIFVRFLVGFPAFGRTIDADGLDKILFGYLPGLVRESLFLRETDQKKAKAAVFLAEDQQSLRAQLAAAGYVAFAANGAVLPRESGVSDLPMKGSVPFVSPPSLERTFILPHRGEIRGMALARGITLIVGGGYHGKSTLLTALQMGVYNHIQGDGREFVVTDCSAVKLRAEEGRFIRGCDISLFIRELPSGKDTAHFATLDASGSTSQAAGVIEAAEAGSRLFLMDEDTSATNFMVRDELMQQVIRRDQEPITPFLERAGDLCEKAGISTILVAGSSGAFFYIADRIIQMEAYRPVDITERVRAACENFTPPRTAAEGFALPDFSRKWQAGIPAGNNRRGGRSSRDDRAKIRTAGRDSFSIGRESVDLRCVEQLADAEQTAALARLLRLALEHGTGAGSLRETVDSLWKELDRKGFDALCGSFVPCGLAKPRREEIFACFNRYRG